MAGSTTTFTGRPEGPPVLSFISRSGNGKTACVTSMSVFAVQAGLRVIILDLDPLRECMHWAQLRGDNNGALEVMPTEAAHLATMLHDLRQGHQHDLIILDTPAMSQRGWLTR